ncbi:MAG: ABC transporter ATP-binding protein [Holdemanella sp.]|nr:ABC transporter ATP-binding protein [Holdemanella sp.]
MNNENAIEVRNLYKTFRIEHDGTHSLKEKFVFWNRGRVEYHEVLKDINLDIKKGDTVALIGTNGQGKSTLLKLMTKIYYPTKGTVTTYGVLTSLLELGAGFHIEFTGRENIYFNASIFGLTRSQIDKRLQDIIDFSELGEFIDTPVRTYSSGMFMRLAFSVAINVDADILLIDEILAVGDQHFQEKCYAKLRELRDSGKTIVIVTHSLEAVRDLCTRAIWIYKGRVHMDGNPDDVVDSYLKQVALDHRVEKKRTAQCHLMIDCPEHMQAFPKTDDTFTINGWMCCDDPLAKPVVKIDGNEIDIDRNERKDVYLAYANVYNGLLDAKTLGWIKELKRSDFKPGIHKLSLSCVDSSENVVETKECYFIVD